MSNLKTSLYLAFWFVFITTFAFLIPYYTNDYRYQLIELTDDKVQNFYDIIVSQYRHYLYWGGRTPPHVLAQTLLLAGKYVSALATGLCYLTLVYLIYIFALGKKVNPFKLPLLPVVFITMGLWVCLRAYGEVVFMLVTSCNYLYTTNFILAFILPYRVAIENTDKKHNVLFGLVMFVLGIIAGWCNENTGFAICSITGLLCLYLLVKKELKIYQALGLIGMGIGFLTLVLSPGNEARLDLMEQTGTFNYFAHMSVTISIFFLSLAENLPIILTFIYFRFLWKKNNLQNKYRSALNGAYFAALIGFASLAIMIFSPNFPGRSAAPFTVFMLVAVISLYIPIAKERIWVVKHKTLISILAIFFVYFALTATNAVNALFQARADEVERNDLIQAQLANGDKDILVTPYHVQASRYIFVSDVKVDKKNFANVILKRYYHVNSFANVCDIKKTVWHSDLIIMQDVKDIVCTKN